MQTLFLRHLIPKRNIRLVVEGEKLKSAAEADHWVSTIEKDFLRVAVGDN